MIAIKERLKGQNTLSSNYKPFRTPALISWWMNSISEAILIIATHHIFIIKISSPKQINSKKDITKSTAYLVEHTMKITDILTLIKESFQHRMQPTNKDRLKLETSSMSKQTGSIRRISSLRISEIWLYSLVM